MAALCTGNLGHPPGELVPVDLPDWPWGISPIAHCHHLFSGKPQQKVTNGSEPRVPTGVAGGEEPLWYARYLCQTWVHFKFKAHLVFLGACQGLKQVVCSGERHPGRISPMHLTEH